MCDCSPGGDPPPISDNRADGVSSALAVAEDLEIADLDFRIDSLTHPVTGQVSLMLRAPDGTGSDLVWRRGGLMSPNQGVAADLIGVTIDDDLPLIAAEDLNQSTVPQAPFTGDWLPAWARSDSSVAATGRQQQRRHLAGSCSGRRCDRCRDLERLVDPGQAAHSRLQRFPAAGDLRQRL